MNNEIKEILDRLDYKEWEVDLYKVPITWCELYDIRDYITNLQQELIKFQEFKEEHKIMKQILIENGLWERLLNDDRFLKYLRNDEDEQ